MVERIYNADNQINNIESNIIAIAILNKNLKFFPKLKAI